MVGGYDPANDDVRPLRGVRIQADLTALGAAGARTCRYVTPDADPIALPVNGSSVQIPRLILWGILVFEAGHRVAAALAEDHDSQQELQQLASVD